ncbi:MULTISPECIES: SDR family NAD(P)-dependent oxidoreductase [Streptacidiphilus]|uniref:SDR family NAD(P)-dependent oxidoreductase n=1 Tax=Streptacidiphilus cavernicola TaxID=3342716 RepID=A0ABV6UIC3_9ACTN|nr:SDR family NAD(P)-dependent oxidoreductase [Streptacidiphilus jeojiense]
MTLLTTPFNRDTTADEVLHGVDLSGRRAVVTGGSSGVGLETARALARAGAEVTLAVRDTAKGAGVAAEITADTGNTQVAVAPLELTDLDSVRAFAADWQGPLHILVNNAGIMALPELQLTPQGWETQFATNHLGHFALATGLHRALAAEGGRIVAVSSTAHLYSPVVFEDIHYAQRPYLPIEAYGQSKTAIVLFAAEAGRRWAADGITANSLMPGGIRTPLQRYAYGDDMSDQARAVYDSYPWRSAAQGAATSALLAGSPLVEGVTGRYFQNSAEAPVIAPEAIGSDLEPVGVAGYALDPGAARRLWEVSAAAVG